MSASCYLTAVFDNCVPRWQLGSCSVTRPFLSLWRVWLARLHCYTSWEAKWMVFNELDASVSNSTRYNNPTGSISLLCRYVNCHDWLSALYKVEAKCMLRTLKQAHRIGLSVQFSYSLLFKMAVHIQKYAKICRNCLLLPAVFCSNPTLAQSNLVHRIKFWWLGLVIINILVT